MKAIELKNRKANEREKKGNGMKTTAGILSLVSVAMLLGSSGCSTLHNSSSDPLQGTWKGREIGNAPEAPRELVISGRHVEYRGATPNDWGKGTFTLREDTQPRQLLVALTECGFAQYMGKTACMIYKIEDRTLTIAASEPGNSAPSSFDAAGARLMVFKKE